MSDRQKVFISFSGLLTAMRDGKVTPEDLENGLFYFGCVREHVFSSDDNSDVNRIFHDDPVAGALAFVRIQTAVHNAETDGRAVFRPDDGRPCLDQLNDLLYHRGLPMIVKNRALTMGYSVLAVFVAAEDQKHPAEFIGC